MSLHPQRNGFVQGAHYTQYNRVENIGTRLQKDEMIEAAYLESNSSLLGFYKNFIRMLLESLGRDVNEIENYLNVKKMEDPKLLVYNLQSKGIFSSQEYEQLAKLHRGEGNNSFPKQEAKQTVSGLLTKIEKRISPELVSGLRSAEVINSSHFLEFLERTVSNSNNTVVDEKRLFETVKQSDANHYLRAVQFLGDQYSTREQMNQLQAKIVQQNSEISHLHQLQNRSIKITESLTYRLNKLSPTLPFNGLNLEHILEEFERSLERLEKEKKEVTRKCESLDQELLHKKIEMTKQTNEANEKLVQALSKESNARQFADQISKVLLLTEARQAETKSDEVSDFSGHLKAIEEIAFKNKSLKEQVDLSSRSSSEEVQELRAKVTAAEEELLRLRSEVSKPRIPEEYVREVGEKDKEILRMKNQINDVVAELGVVRSERDNALSKITILVNSEKELQAKVLDGLNKLEKSEKESEKKNREATDFIKELSIRIKSLEEENTASKSLSESELISAQLSSNQQAEILIEKEELIKGLQAQISDLKNEASTARDRAREQAEINEGLRRENERLSSNPPETPKKDFQEVIIEAGISHIKASFPERHNTSQKTSQGRDPSVPQLESQLTEKDRTIETLNEKILTLTQALTETQTRASESHSEDLSILKTQLEEYRQKDAKVVQQAIDMGVERERLEDLDNQLIEKARNLDQKQSHLDSSMKAFGERMSQLDSKTLEIQETQANLEIREREVKKQIERIGEVGEFERQAREQIERLQSEKNSSEVQNQTLRADLTKIKEDLQSMSRVLSEEQVKSAGLEKKVEGLEVRNRELAQGSEVVGTQEREILDLRYQLESSSTEISAQKELVSVLEEQVEKLKAVQKEDAARAQATISHLNARLSDYDSLKSALEDFEKENAHYKEQMEIAQSIQEHNQELEARVKELIEGGADVEDQQALREEVNRVQEENEGLMEKMGVAQEILEENESLKEKVEGMQRDNEMMAQALEEINAKIEEGLIIIVDMDNVGAALGKVKSLMRNGEEELDLNDVDVQELVEELKSVKVQYEEIREEQLEKEEEYERVRGENEELKEQLRGILAQMGQGEEEEGEAEGEEERGRREQTSERNRERDEAGEEEGAEEEDINSDVILDENDQMIEVLKALSGDIVTLRGVYVEMIQELLKKNEEKGDKGLNYEEFVRSAEEMQQKVKESRDERGAENMKDFNSGLKESVDFYDSEKQKLIKRIHSIEKWCKEDDPEEEENAEAGEEEETGQENAEGEGEEEAGVSNRSENDELSVDKLVELLLITLQLIEGIRETAMSEGVSEQERLESIVESINKFEQMGDSGHGNFELATILQNIVQNKSGEEAQEGAAYGGEEEQEENEGQEERQEENEGQEEEEMDFDTLKENFEKVCQMLNEKEKEMEEMQLQNVYLNDELQTSIRKLDAYTEKNAEGDEIVSREA